MSFASDPELLQSFVGEAREYLAAMEEFLLPAANENVMRLRAEKAAGHAHALKGVAGMLELKTIHAPARILEEHLRGASLRGPQSDDRMIIRGCLRTISRMVDLVESGRLGELGALHAEFQVCYDILKAATLRLRRREETEAGEIEELRRAFHEELSEMREQIAIHVKRLRDDPEDTPALAAILGVLSNLENSASVIGQTWNERLASQARNWLATMAGAPRESWTNALNWLDLLVQGMGELIQHHDRDGAIQSAIAASVLEKLPAFQVETAAPKPAASPAGAEADTPDSSLVEVFLAEASEILEHMAGAMVDLKPGRGNESAILDLFRATHSLKGSASTVGLRGFSRLAHDLESLFESVREGRRKLDPALLQEMFDGVQRLHEALDAVRAHASPAARAPAAESARPAQPERPADFAFVRVQADRLDLLLDHLSALMINRSRLMESRKLLRMHFSGFEGGKDRLREEIDAFLDKYEYSMTPGARAAQARMAMAGAAQAPFSGIEFDHYNDANILARRLDAAADGIAAAVRGFELALRDIELQLSRMDETINNLKDTMLDLRMVPMELVFNRFRRAVQDTASRLGREIRVEVRGEAVRLDKSVAEPLTPALLQLARNAVAHGVESSEERRRAGKPEEGVITIEAETLRNRLVIGVSDDGRGIDVEAIRRAAVEKGLMDEATAQSLPRDRVAEVIFLPGFSTSTDPDEVSGRGVGLNAVQDIVHHLDGTIAIEFEPGKGTSFIIGVPQTQAIIRILLVRAGETICGVPASAVAAAVLVNAADVRGEPGRQELRWKDQWLPLFDLAQFTAASPSPPGFRKRPALITGEDSLTAVLVDEIVGLEDAVLRPFDEFLGGKSHFSGAAISGDGRLHMVFETAGLADLARGQYAQPARIASRSQRQTTVLLADDSLSIRKAVGRMLEGGGYRVETVTDGEEAWQWLKDHEADLVVTDLEMPRRNGYELLQVIREHPRLSRLPVVILTSRTAEKHRRHAIELGASGYVTKPVSQAELLTLVRSLLQWSGAQS